MTEQTYTTAEAAKKIGRAVVTLQGWVRDGKLAPKTTGEGKRKRIHWTADDINAGKALALDGQMRELTRLAHEVFGGVLPHLEQGTIRASFAESGHVVVVGPLGPRTFRHDELLSVVRRRCGAGTLVILDAPPDEQI